MAASVYHVHRTPPLLPLTCEAHPEARTALHSEAKQVDNSLLMTTTLLRTKFYIPRPARLLVAREALIQRLNQGLERDLSLVVAPVGYGKTKLKDPGQPMAEVNRRVQVVNMENKATASNAGK